MAHTSTPRKVLLVTDIGSDVDDIWCLLVLAQLQEQGTVKVVGIVTTGGNCQTRKRLAQRWALALSLVDAKLIVAGSPDNHPGQDVPGL
jgi:inosine-uridine nucleoside N-ribohydrolase